MKICTATDYVLFLEIESNEEVLVPLTVDENDTINKSCEDHY